MKTKLFFIGMLLWGVSMIGQEVVDKKALKEELKLELKNELDSESKGISVVTVGVGVGGNHLFKDVYDYSLTTDGTHKLKINTTNSNNLVISPVVAFRLSKLYKKSKTNKLFDSEGNEVMDFKNVSLLLSLNLLDVKSDKIGFNEIIDGGIGIGYAFATNLQIGLFYEIKRYRQMRPYIVETYKDASIPMGTTEYYNSLDKADNNLFYDKTMEGFSVKLIFNINSL